MLRWLTELRTFIFINAYWNFMESKRWMWAQLGDGLKFSLVPVEIFVTNQVKSTK